MTRTLVVDDEAQEEAEGQVAYYVERAGSAVALAFVAEPCGLTTRFRWYLHRRRYVARKTVDHRDDVVADIQPRAPMLIRMTTRPEHQSRAVGRNL
jgi:hypothetical protein